MGWRDIRLKHTPTHIHTIEVFQYNSILSDAVKDPELLEGLPALNLLMPLSCLIPLSSHILFLYQDLFALMARLNTLLSAVL